MSRPCALLVIGIGSQKDRDSRPYREHLLAGAARAYPLWLLETDELTWQKPYTVGSSVVRAPTAETLVTAAREVATHHDILGVLCPDEGLLLPAAHVAVELGLPGATLQAVRACRDKKRSRRLMTDAGLLQPRHTSVSSVDELRAAVADYGLPVVLKPRAFGSSRGVVKVDDPDQLDRAFAITTAARYPGIAEYPDIVVEEYLTGPEISVDGSLIDGVYRPHILARKTLGPPPFFEEIGHVVRPDDPALEDPQILQLLQRGHAALGFHHGMTHAEIKFTSRGPVIIEINGRPGGDLIPRLGWLSTGVDLGRIAAQVAAGAQPSPDALASAERSPAPRTVGIRFCLPAHDLEITGVRLPRPADHAGLLEAAALASPGTVLRRPPANYTGRAAYLIAEGANPAECTARLDELERFVTISGVPT